MNLTIQCPWLHGDIFTCDQDKDVQISVVAYQYPIGMPARFCAGLIPAVVLAKQLALHNVAATIRIIDPSSIANYCNGWATGNLEFHDVLKDFLREHEVSFFFDEAKPVTDSSLKVLNVVGQELTSPSNNEVAEMVERIKESGRRHGAESGASNAIFYMAAHPFSWLDMHHPLVWNKKYVAETCQFVNLMSKAESRFTVIRQYLRNKVPALDSGIVSADYYMTICNTPCYLPLEDEPLFTDLEQHGLEWCRNRYQTLKGKSNNHRRALKDFESLLLFQTARSA